MKFRVWRYALVCLWMGVCSTSLRAQIIGANLPFVQPQFFSTNGNSPCGGCKLYSYVAGTTTPTATFADYDLLTPNPNPLILNSLGRPPGSDGIYLGNASYKFVLETATGAMVWTRDNIYDLAELLQSGAIIFTGIIDSKTINNVQMCDAYPGVDASEKINNCIAALPSTGGVANAVGLQGPQTLSTTISITKPVKLLLGYGVWTSGASPVIQVTTDGQNSEVACGGNPGQSTNAGANSCVLATTNTSGDIVQTAGQSTSVHDLTLMYSGGSARTGGAGVNCKAGGSIQLDSLRIVSTWIGLSMAEGSCSGSVSRVLFTNLHAGSGGAWYAMVALGGCTGVNTPAALGCGQAMQFTVTDLHFSDIILSVGSVMGSGAAFLMDGGTDSVSFLKMEIVKTGSCATSDCGIMWKLQNTVAGVGFDPPRWVTCIACEFEGTAVGATSPVIQVNAAKGFKLLGNTDIAGGTQGLYLSPGTGAGQYIADVDISDTNFVQPGQECIKAAAVNTGQTPGPSGIAIGPLDIHDNAFTGCSQQTNGGYNAIQIGADVTNFTIHHNNFGWQDFAYTNHPAYYIGIASGGSDQFTIDRNNFNQTYRVSGDISDSSSGSVKLIGPDIHGSLQTDQRIYGPFITTKGYGPTSLPTTTSLSIGCGGSGDPSVACSQAFSDGSGRSLNFGYVTGGIFTPTFKLWDTGIITLMSSTFATLNLHGTTANGSVLYCSDCAGPTDGGYTAGAVAAGGGSGALVVRINGTWRTY